MDYTEKKRSRARISVNKLGEYMVATASRRRTIIKDQKKPKAFITAVYTDAQKNIVDFLIGELDYDALIAKAENILLNTSSSGWSDNKNASCTEAIEAFVAMTDDLCFENCELAKGEQKPEKIKLANVDISVRPELAVSGQPPGSRKGTKATGAVKLYFSKNIALTKESGEYIATMVHQYVENHVDLENADHRLCYVIDVFRGTIYKAPKSNKRRRQDLEAACEEIHRAWIAA